MVNRIAEHITAWLEHGKSFNTPNSSLRGVNNMLFTYSVALAQIDRERKVIRVNQDYYSVTSSRHRNMVTVRAIQEGYSVTELATESDLLHFLAEGN